MSQTINRLLLAILFAATFIAPAVAIAQKDKTQAVPTQVEADRMESSDKDNAVVFFGNVVAKQGGLLIHADKMTVYYLSGEEKQKLSPGAQRKIKKLYADGHVEIQNQGWVSTSDHMEFFELERKVKLTGNAKAWQGNNMVTGESIILFLDEGKSIVERSKEGERVKAFFYPGEEKKTKKD